MKDRKIIVNGETIVDDRCNGNKDCLEYLDFTGHLGIWTCPFWDDEKGCTNGEISHE